MILWEGFSIQRTGSGWIVFHAATYVGSALSLDSALSLAAQAQTHTTED